MRFIPLTESDKEQMLEVIGAHSVDELFSDIPEKARTKKELNLPGPLAEPELAEYFEALAAANKPAGARGCFMGAGAYRHDTPAAVDQLLLRSEFFTAYTPYQPEVSQGTLMAIYEFQTYTASLFGMDVANASMYDGASSLAEAVIMAGRTARKNRVAVSNLVHPGWRAVAETYTQHHGIDLVDIDCLGEGVISGDRLKSAVDDKTAAVVVQYPNFLGHIEDLAAVREACDANGAMMIVAVAEPVAMGMLKGPGDFGADIVVGEGRSFGGTLSYGGPGLGLFATKKEWVRSMPGRLVGKTKDADGEDGYVLTLATREQHIRRDRATSNICSNQALCATAFAIHLSLLGREGLKDLALRNLSAARYMAETISSIKGFERIYDLPFFNEVAFRLPVEPAVINKRLAEEGFLGGFDLSGEYDLNCSALFCATEINSKESIDRLAEILSEFEK